MSGLQLMWIRLTADKTRFMVLCGVTCAGLLLWARLILVSGQPRTAIAEPEAGGDRAPAAAAGAEGSGEEAPSDGGFATEPAPQAIVLVDVPARDPFETDPRHFPHPHDPQGLTADGAKSGSGPADTTGAETALPVRIAAALAKRRLEAAVPTADLAVIDGRRIRLGEHLVLDEPRVRLRVVEVRQRSIVLVPEGGPDGERFVLRMSGTGG